MPRLHVVIPVYNERGTLEPCMRRVLAVSLPHAWELSLTLIDDKSDEAHFPAVANVVDTLKAEGQPLTFMRHDVNRGKGAALQTGFDTILGRPASDDDLVIIQDADLEYDPSDFPKLMQPLIRHEADAVFGTRWGSHMPLNGLKRKLHAWGNGLLTCLSNLMTGYSVSDMECCYKVFTVRLLRRLRPMLTEQRFGIEPQLVAGMARLRARVSEVPVHYDPRSLSAGKKIGWTDGARALYVIAREKIKKLPA